MTDYPKIPEAALRLIAKGAMGIGAPLVLTHADQAAVCAELLAKREECEALSHRAEDAENQLRCVTLTGDAVASDSSLYCGNSVRYWYDKANAYKDSAGKLCEARKERDAARAEAEKLRKFAERNGKAATERFDLLVRCREALGISGDEPTLAQIGLVPGLVAGVVARLEQNDRDLRAARPRSCGRSGTSWPAPLWSLPVPPIRCAPCSMHAARRRRNGLAPLPR
jgi:hypothetical protein